MAIVPNFRIPWNACSLVFCPLKVKMLSQYMVLVHRKELDLNKFTIKDKLSPVTLHIDGVANRGPKMLPQPLAGQQAPHGSNKDYEIANMYAE
jgi:hypothetical protein